MTKCPFCHYENEDEALFCERCSSDLSGVAPTPSPSAPPPPPPIPAADPIPMAFADPIPMAFADPIPEAAPFEAIPEAAPFEAIPVHIPEPVYTPEPVHIPEPVPVAAVPALDMTPPPAPVDLTPIAPPPPPPAFVPPPPAEAAPPPPPVMAAPPTAQAPTAPTASGPLPAGAQPRLQVLRGQKRNVEYPIYEGMNYIGRADEKPVDIDLEEQEPPDRIWCSRQHAVITFEGGVVSIEDLNSANGTYVNRTRVYPGQPKPLAVNDIVQIGNVQMKVVV